MFFDNILKLVAFLLKKVLQVLDSLSEQEALVIIHPSFRFRIKKTLGQGIVIYIWFLAENHTNIINMPLMSLQVSD